MKKLRIMMALALSLGLFTACGNNEQPADEPAETAPVETTETETTEEPAETETETETTTETEVTTEEVEYADGVYEALAAGEAGDIKVEVEIKEGKIETLKVLDNTEDATNEAINEALTSIPEQIVTNNGTEGVEVVEGAEKTSQGIIDATNEALNAAVVK